MSKIAGFLDDLVEEIKVAPKLFAQFSELQADLAFYHKQQPPCSAACYHHQTHPCEECGRLNGLPPSVYEENKQLQTELDEFKQGVADFNKGWEAAQSGESLGDRMDEEMQGWQVFMFDELQAELEAIEIKKIDAIAAKVTAENECLILRGEIEVWKAVNK